MSENNKALLAELKEIQASDSTKTVSDVATTLQQTDKNLKVREVKKFVKHMSAKAIANNAQVSIKERRSYRLDNESENLSADVLFTTYAFYHDATKRVFLSVEKMRELREQYISALAQNAHFTIQSVYKHYDITGSNRSDTARNAFKAVSFECTKSEAEKDLAAVIAKAKDAKKQCVYYNITDSKHKCYEFVKV